MKAVIEIMAVFGLATALLSGWYIYCRKTGRSFGPRIYSSNVTLGVFVFLRVLTLMTLVRAAYIGNYDHIKLCILTLLLISMPSILERTLKIKLPTVMEVIFLCFVFAAEILGEINHFYTLVSGWDTALHTINGFLCAAVGFALVDMLNRSSRTSLSLSPLYLAITAFCFSMTVGVLWEFFEFGMDQVFLTDTQKDFIVTAFASTRLGGGDPITVKDIVQTVITTAEGRTVVIDGYLDIGIIDTMKDLFVNFIGALSFSIIGFFYVKHRGTGKIASQFIPQVSEEGGKSNASNSIGDH
ncbi:MAG: hypothetical protein Q4E57_06940 [Eubacteriales bacterium]|nr:hypothetical protein [Eubacteriales bacterium]